MSTAHWREADDPGNPFGVRIVDLMANLQLTSTSQDPEIAARAVSWRAGMQRLVEIEVDGTRVEGELRFPCVSGLPDGMLAVPDQMEDKWVVVHRDGHVAAARSWTGETKAVARARHLGETLLLDQLTLAPGSGFDTFGDPLRVFDWFVRTHALRNRIPMPVSAEGATMLLDQPLMGFSVFGRKLFCAAVELDLGEPRGVLFSHGDLVAAVGIGDLARLGEALAAGADPNAPIRFNDGGTALHLAVVLHPELIEPLLDGGADVNAPSIHGSTPLMSAATCDADRRTFDRLIAGGAEVQAADELGFTALHVAAQFGKLGALESLVAHGADLEARTLRGLTPLHVAAGTGQTEAAQWLVARGLSPHDASPLGTPVSIADGEGHADLARMLERG